MDEDEVAYSTSPSLPHEKANRRLEVGDEEDYKKARDKSLPILERGDALARICEAISHSSKTDDNTRKVALEQIFQLFTELGNQKSANILTDLLFDSSLEVSTMAMNNIATFVAKTDDKDFEAIIYAVTEDLALAENKTPVSISSGKYNAIQGAAKYLMKNYPSQFIPAIFAPGSIAKGSLKWLATNYRTLKSEIFDDNSEAGVDADRALMAALKSASSQLTDTIGKAITSMDALTTVVKSVQSVLGVYSDLLRASGEPGVVIVSTALASPNISQSIQPPQRHIPERLHMGVPRHHVDRPRDITGSQVSPKTLDPLTRRFSSGIDAHANSPLTPVSRQRPSMASAHGGTSSSTHNASPYDRGSSPNTSVQYTPASTRHHQRSSSAPSTPTPVKRAFSQVDLQDTEPKLPRKGEHNSKTPSPTHGPQRQGSSVGQGGAEPYRGSGGRGYQGKNFIPGFRGRGGFRNRPESFRSGLWRGKHSQLNGRSERSEYQGYPRGSDYPHRINYD